MGGSVKKLGKSVGGLAGKVVDPLNMSKGAVGGALGGDMKGISNLLFGKEVKAQKSGFMPLDQTQVKALGGYNKLLDQDMKGFADQQIAASERGIRQGGEDATRQAQQMVAQRGLGNSSVGLNAILNQKRDMANQIGANRARLPGLQYDMNLANLNSATKGIQDILGSRMYQNGTPGGQRSGGIAGILGGAVGAKFGGPQGAMAGYQLGNSLGNSGMV